MISDLNIKHSLDYSFFSGQVYYNGKTELLRGSVDYSNEIIRIHDPFAHKTHKLPLNDYTNFEGDMKEFISHIIISEGETK